MALSEAINRTDPSRVQLVQRRLLVASDNDGIVARIGSFGVGSLAVRGGRSRIEEIKPTDGTPNDAVQSESVIICLSSALHADRVINSRCD